MALPKGQAMLRQAMHQILVVVELPAVILVLSQEVEHQEPKDKLKDQLKDQLKDILDMDRVGRVDHLGKIDFEGNYDLILIIKIIKLYKMD